MLSCKEVSRLLSESQDHKLTSWQAVQIWMHLLMCGLCRQFRRQIRFINQAISRYRILEKQLDIESACLSEDARHRFEQSIRSHSTNSPTSGK